MGEDDGNDNPLDEDEGEEVPMRKIVSLGKFYGSLVGEGALSLHILKVYIALLGVGALQTSTDYGCL